MAKFWKHRYDAINDFEEHLTESGTVILKFFLNSPSTSSASGSWPAQRPCQDWNSPPRTSDRALGRIHGRPIEDASTPPPRTDAPWYVIPADRKWAMRTAVADIVTTTLLDMDLAYPTLDDAALAGLQTAKTSLQSEGT